MISRAQEDRCLSLRATKETAARAIGRSMAAMVERRDICGWPCQIWRQAAAFQRFLPRRSRAQGAAGRSSPRRVPAPHTGRLKRRALPLVLPRGGARSSYSSGASKSKPDLGPYLRLGGPRRKSPDTWGCRTSEGRPLWGRKELQVAYLSPVPSTQGDWDTRHPWGGL